MLSFSSPFAHHVVPLKWYNCNFTEIVTQQRENTMTDVSAAPALSSEVSTPKKIGKKTGVKAGGRAKASHPPTAVMVNSAIKSLKERGGSSLQAIKKYVSSTYKIDAEKLAPFIKKYIKASVTSGALVQTKGKGASGSFKLAANTAAKISSSDASEKKTKKAVPRTTSAKAKKAVDEAAGASAGKKVQLKKAATKPKKAAVVKKPVAKSAKPKASPKAKKTAKAPTKKPKSPKPKTTKLKAAARTPKKTAGPAKKK